MKPRWATCLLHMFFVSHQLDELEGDLDELFQQRVELLGLRRAQWRYVRDIVSLMRPSLMRPSLMRPPLQYQQPTSDYPQPFFLAPTMISNYVKIAWRNLMRAKGYASLNIAGLAVGMAASALIFLWIQSELTYDRFYTKTDRLFQVYNRDVFSGNAQVWGYYAKAVSACLKTGLSRD